LWLDAGSGVETTGDNLVTQWANQARDGRQAEAKGTPVLIPNALNNEPVVRFDGQDDWLALARNVVTSAQYTIIAVVSDAASGGPRNLIGNWDDSKGNSTSSIFLGTVGGDSVGRNVRFTDDYAMDASDEALEKPLEHFVLTAISESYDARVFQNARLLGAQGAAIAGRKFDTAWTVGRQGTLDGEYWDGDVAEILVYAAVLNETVRRQVWQYLGEKYELSGLELISKPVGPDDAHRLALIQACRVIFNLNEFVYAD